MLKALCRAQEQTGLGKRVIRTHPLVVTQHGNTIPFGASTEELNPPHRIQGRMVCGVAEFKTSDAGGSNEEPKYSTSCTRALQGGE